MQTLDIVTSYFTNLNGQKTVGLFLIVNTGTELPYAKNSVGYKITSKPLFLDKYSIAITKSDYKFLQTDSWIQTNKPHVLLTNECKVVGKLNNSDIITVYNKLNEFNLYNSQQIINQVLKGGI
jgi:hypothetical protein